MLTLVAVGASAAAFDPAWPVTTPELTERRCTTLITRHGLPLAPRGTASAGTCTRPLPRALPRHKRLASMAPAPTSTLPTLRYASARRYPPLRGCCCCCATRSLARCAWCASLPHSHHIPKPAPTHTQRATQRAKRISRFFALTSAPALLAPLAPTPGAWQPSSVRARQERRLVREEAASRGGGPLAVL